jgi:hypothetical protein
MTLQDTATEHVLPLVAFKFRLIVVHVSTAVAFRTCFFLSRVVRHGHFLLLLLLMILSRCLRCRSWCLRLAALRERGNSPRLGLGVGSSLLPLLMKAAEGGGGRTASGPDGEQPTELQEVL